jgi:hypothetical protein
MIMPDPAEPLMEKAQRYLKERYGEDTLAMTVTQNSVEGGSGVLSVDCTVRFGGVASDWSKKFTFANEQVLTMSARMR